MARGVKPRWGALGIGAVLGALAFSYTGVAALGGAMNGWLLGAVAGVALVLVIQPQQRPSSGQDEALRTPLPSVPVPQLTEQQVNERKEQAAHRLIGRVRQWGGALVLACLLAAFFAGRHNDPPRPSPQGVAAPQPAAAPQGATLQQQRSAAYDATVRQIELRYPVLNPDLPQYDAQLVGQVLQQKDALVSQGLEPAQAVLRAVDQVMARRGQPSPTAVGAAQQAPRPCVYKAVMTDDDYRACGARPPGADR